MRLIYCHDIVFREYLSSVRCLYNIKSIYERIRQEQLRKLEAERLAALEEKMKAVAFLERA